MRILHVSHTTDLGLRVVATHALAQAANGDQVAIACREEDAVREWRGLGLVRHLPWPAGREPGFRTPLEAARLRRIVLDFEPDVVHLHSSKAGLAGRASVRGRVPTVFQPHAWSFEAAADPMRSIVVAWERYAARWADAVVCVSRSERDRGRQMRIPGHMVVVPNGVDVGTIRPLSEDERAETRTRLGLPDGPLVVCVGRLSPQKGQDVLLDAWPAVVASVPDASLVLVGDGPHRPALEAKRSPHMAFVGKRRDAVSFIAAADVVVQPSRYEGMSVAILEAMAAGRPVVAANAQGVRESLGEGAGAIVPVGSSPALTEAIVTRLREPEISEAEGRRGRRRAEGLFEIEKATAAVRELYEEVLEHRASRRRVFGPART